MTGSQRSLAALLWVCLVLGSVPPGARAGRDEDSFNRVYRDEIRRVLATKNAADDAQLARALLIAAGRAKDRPGLVGLLCENAYTLGLHGQDGYAVAIEAMALLAETFPHRRDEAAEKAIAARRVQFRRAAGRRREELGGRLVAAILDLAARKARGGDRAAAAEVAREALPFTLGPKREEVLRQVRQYASSPELSDPKVTAEFEAAYGRQIKQALATRSVKDDAALAAMFAAAAQDSCVRAPRRVLLCEQAYRLGKRSPAGYPAAIEAMELLADTVESRQGVALERLVALWRLQANASRGAQRREACEKRIGVLLQLADVRAESGRLAEAVELVRKARSAAAAIDPGDRPEIEAKLAYLAGRKKLAQEIGRLRARLRSRPADAAARERLIVLYVCELDDPAEARTCLTEQTDPDLARLVEQACKDPAGLSGREGLQLGAWYESLAGESVLAKVKMLSRARAAYGRCLAGEAEDSPDRRRAMQAIARIDLALTLAASARTRAQRRQSEGEWLDVLKRVKPAAHGLRGKWHRLPTGLHVGLQPGAGLILPVHPAGSYELELELRPEAGNGHGVVAIVLPVGRTAAEVILGREGGPGSGLQMIGRQGYRVNPTHVKGGLTLGRVNTVLVRVALDDRRADIGVVLDGRRLVRWKGAVSLLSPGPFRMPDLRAVGLAAHLRQVLFQSIRLRMIDGEAKMLVRTADRRRPRR